MDAELIAYLDQRFAALDERFAAIDRRFDELRAEIAADIAASATTLRTEMTRHFDVVVETMMSKMELIVEGVRTVDQRLDRFNGEVRKEFR